MKFFTAAALFVATAMAYPPNSNNGNGNAVSKTDVKQIQVLEDRCKQQQKATMCCDEFTQKNTVSSGGLLNNFLSGLDLKDAANLALVQNLLAGDGGQCRGVATLLDGNCANKAACCDHIENGDQNGLVNVGVPINCVALPL
ncbi:hypothetical protein ETB97_011913 [Aspergillus alliaceus]|uniref:Uncharacterized protein n=1 Tax=Petromyces alliaceus TaxID=209559 RepID=A0A5N6FV32_PETAA|nr:uncharacterized protein BDW43DRAFT_310880 [Aspergillus alliaceus]KAB8233881.1 hypothetical protein BDW43DRAFT_310880 [Aspergillus alliaceus]KAF5862208.1 hypothetical protein ETB97_011913 [Aspergillus burnettii]